MVAAGQQPNEAEYWETLLTGGKARGTQPEARLAAYAATQYTSRRSTSSAS